MRTPAGGGPRQVRAENPRPRKRARVTFASQELSALPFIRRRPTRRRRTPGDPIADLLDHLSAALDSADAVRAAICDGDEATQRSDGARRGRARLGADVERAPTGARRARRPFYGTRSRRWRTTARRRRSRRATPRS